MNRIAINRYGVREPYLKGLLHKEDGPAIECEDGSKAWYINGKRHRVGGPAVEDSGGYKAWYINGKLHREDGPSIEYSNGGKEWYINGKKFKTKETWFEALKEEDKEKALFSEHFIIG